MAETRKRPKRRGGNDSLEAIRKAKENGNKLPPSAYKTVRSRKKYPNPE